MNLSVERVASVDPRKLAEALRRECENWRTYDGVADRFAAALLAVLDWADKVIEEGTYASGGFTTSTGMAVSAEDIIRAAARAWLEAGGTLEVT